MSLRASKALLLNLNAVGFGALGLVMKKLRVLTLLSLIFLSACQTWPSSKSVVEADQYWHQDSVYFDSARARVEQLQQWRYTAKVGITTPTVREVANIVWSIEDQANDVRLFGPLGIGAVSLQFDQYGAALSDNGGLIHRGGSAQSLLTKIVGWPIPIDALSSWLHVLPKPGSVYRYRLNEIGTEVTQLDQLGWQIQYSSYRLYGEGDSAALLPRKIVATKVLPNQEKMVVKLVTKSWAF
jgi:outer membrane lipoprotein LolB